MNRMLVNKCKGLLFDGVGFLDKCGQQVRGLYKQRMVKYIQNYVLYESIGSGVYGKVYRAINNNDKKEYAIKVIPITKFKQNKKLQECTVNEINILTNIQAHANIIKYYDMLKTSNNFYFIYQYCNGGTLEGLLAKQGKLSEQNALLIFKQLLQAFQVLNKYNIMHRDMKPDNIFFHNGVIKLGDFGFCKNLNSADQMTKTMLGSPIYMAPEVLKGEIYSNKADIWSLGVVLFQMIYGQCPFQSNSIANLIQVLNSKQLYFPGQISNFLKTLITRMLTKDPIRRISWMQLFQIKINSLGEVQSQKITNKINSLNQAKSFEQGHGHMAQSNKMIAKLQSMGVMDEPNRDFKKNRNLSNTASQNSQGSINHVNMSPNHINMGYNQNPISSPTLPHQPIPVPPIQNPINQIQAQIPQNSPTQLPPSITINNPNGLQPTITNPNGLQPTTNKINGQQFQQGGKGNIISRLGEDHRMVIEGVKLAMQIIDSKLPNHMGYAHLLLSRVLTVLNDICAKSTRKDVSQLLQKQLREIQAEREAINSKMFAYELKGLEDWKKYLRGKFFEEESTIIYWFKMVTYLNGSYGVYNLNQNSPAEIVKQILY